MRHFIRIIFCTIAVFCFAGYAKAEDTALKITEQFSPGYNIGNSFDTGAEETALGNPIVTEELIQQIKQEGFESVRIPITWSGHFDETYTIDELFFKRLDQVIKTALEEDLYVVINMQRDSYEWFCKNKDSKSKEHFIHLWSQIAEHYKDYSSQLCFELIHEPYFEGMEKANQLKLLEECYTGAIQAIRKTGANNTKRLILLSTLNSEIMKSSVESLSNYLIKQSDKNLAASVSYYGMWEFSVNCAGVNQFSNEVKNHIIEAFKLTKKYFVDKKIAVVCDEYGLMGYHNHSEGIKYSELLKWYDAVNTYAREYQLPLMLWDAGTFIDRYDMKWKDETLKNFIKESYIKQNSYANTDRIYVRKGAAYGDQILILQLHDTDFVNIMEGYHILEEGIDYTYNKSKLTIKKEYLQKVCTKGLGINAKLRISFKNGKSWPLTIIQYDIPKFDSTSGTEEELVIPAQFHEDTLVSMEAFYEDKTIAGPINWSGYQEYGYSFEPNYNMEVIYLKKPFLSQLKENKTVTLHFDFYSGAKVTYQIVRNGEEVKEINFKESEEVKEPELIVPQTTEQPNELEEKLKEATMKKQTNVPKKTAVLVLLAFLLSLGSIIYYLRERYIIKKMFERFRSKKD